MPKSVFLFVLIYAPQEVFFLFKDDARRGHPRFQVVVVERVERFPRAEVFIRNIFCFQRFSQFLAAAVREDVLNAVVKEQTGEGFLDAEKYLQFVVIFVLRFKFFVMFDAGAVISHRADNGQVDDFAFKVDCGAVENRALDFDIDVGKSQMFAIFGVILAVYRHHGKVSARAVAGDDEVVKVKTVFVGVGDNPLQSLVDLFHVIGEAVFRTETVTDIDGESARARHMLAIAATHFFVAFDPAAAVNHKEHGELSFRKFSALFFVVNNIEFSRVGMFLVIDDIFHFRKSFAGEAVAQ